MSNAANPGRELRFPLDRAKEKSLSDLMTEIRDGSGAALQEFMDRLWPEVVRYAAWELSDGDLAQDMVQGAFVYVWEHRRSWIGVGSPRAYLYRIVRNQIIDHRRHMNVRATWSVKEGARAPRTPPTPAEILAAKDIQEAFDRAVDDLAPRRREAFVLVVLRGLPHREAAEIMGTSLQTVANQVTSALETIRAEVRKATEAGA